MDDITLLQRRNAILHTELRLHKEQHAQANSAIGYLVSQLSAQHESSVLALESRVRRLEIENSSLRAKLTIATVNEGDCTEPIADLWTARRSQPVACRDERSLKDFKSRNFEEDDNSMPSAPRSSLSAIRKVTEEKTISPGSDGADIDTPASRTSYELLELDESNSSKFKIEHADGTASLIDMRDTSSGTSSGRSSQENSNGVCGLDRDHEPTKRRLPLREHQRLLNSAVFTEDIPEPELDSFWNDYSRRHGYWSKSEWRNYYEQVVRPEYVRRKELQTGVSSDDVLSMRDDGTRDCIQVDRDTAVSRDDLQALVNAEETESHSMPATEGLTVVPGAYSSDILPSLTGTHAQLEVSFESCSCGICFTLLTVLEHQEARLFLQSVRKSKDHSISGQRQSPNVQNTRAGMGDVNQPFFSNCRGDEKRRRTVLLAGLPPNMPLAKLFTCIHGGTVVKCRIFATAVMKTKPAMDGDTAIIEFLDTEGARAFISHCAKTAPAFESAEGCTFTARAILLGKPDRPYTNPVHCATCKNPPSRVISIRDWRRQWTVEWLTCKMRQETLGFCNPLRVSHDVEGVMVLEFAGIEEACRAAEMVDGSGYGAEVDFLVDPCAEV